MTAAASPATANSVEGSAPLDAAQALVRRRLSLIVEALGVSTPTGDLATTLTALVSEGDPSVVWLVLAVLRAELPDPAAIEAAHRHLRLDGAAVWVTTECARLARRAHNADRPAPVVRIVRGAVLVDCHLTARARFVSGIQRVVLETVRRWHREHEFVPLGWTNDLRALRPLAAPESARLLSLPEPTDSGTQTDEVLVPWESVVVVAELAIEPPRTLRLQCLAASSGNRLTLIGYDLTPVTSPDTFPVEMSSNFVLFLAAVRHAARVAAISAASATEFRGWRRMVGAAGFGGPDVRAISLPSEPRESSPQQLDHARAVLGVPSLPLVLVVGSHEPRKNHLAVLQAAERLWREGLRFNLVLAGSGSWKAEQFHQTIAELQAVNRPVLAISGLADDTLWAAYRLARCVLFPSFHEGFGLPVVEGLAAGTPVIASDFGSTRELIAPDGIARGGLLVDPHDDDSIVDALRRVLTDDKLHERLSAEARERVFGDWDTYAADTWRYLSLDAP